MACGKSGCGNVMCDRRVTRLDGNGYECDSYLCNDCVDALRTLAKRWKPDLTRRQVLTRVARFMTEDKPDPDDRTGTTRTEDIVEGLIT